MANRYWQKIVRLGIAVCSYDPQKGGFKIARLWIRSEPDDVKDNNLACQENLIGKPITSLPVFEHPKVQTLLESVRRSDNKAAERTVALDVVSLGVTQNMRITAAKATASDIVIYFQEVVANEDKVKFAQDARNHLDALVNQLPLMVCKFLPGNGVITYANKEYCDYFDVDISQIIGKSFLDLIPAEDHAKVLNAFSALDWDNQRVTYDYNVITPKGTRPHRWTNQAVFNQQGRVVEFIAFGFESGKC
ncbi:PAS domain-containing protein [Lentisphaerota bacterium ZTH]|nr:PAS domain-containing protein [Lentisphaerota bacterium]WET06095.1 PAS domain-containing protein [Lentisphaerota bacterium ZTH]